MTKRVLLAALLCLTAARARAERSLIEGKPSTLGVAYVSSNTTAVGISTASPATTLDVNGSASFGLNGAKSTFTATGELDLAGPLTLSGSGGFITSASSVTGTLFGDGKHLTIDVVTSSADWVGLASTPNGNFTVAAGTLTATTRSPNVRVCAQFTVFCNLNSEISVAAFLVDSNYTDPTIPQAGYVIKGWDIAGVANGNTPVTICEPLFNVTEGAHTYAVMLRGTNTATCVLLTASANEHNLLWVEEDP